MNVLYVLRYYPTLTETFVYREATGLLAHGVTVTGVAWGSRADGAAQDRLPPWSIATPPSGWAAARALPALRHLTGARGRAAMRDLSRTTRPKDALRALWLADHAIARGADRLHVHFAGEVAEWTRAAARIAGVPYSVTVHAVDLFRPRPSLPDVLREARPVVTIAEHHRTWIRDHYGVEATVVRCGVDPDVPQAEVASDGPLRVVCVGRFVPKKGIDRLIAAVEAHEGPIHLRLVSETPRSFASERVTIGALPSSQVANALAEAQVFALPCRIAENGDRDGIPVVLIEAMAAGLPVIATSVAGIPELVDATVGWLIPPDDADALSAALVAASDPAERRARGAAARQRVLEHWRLDHQVEGLLAAWERA